VQCHKGRHRFNKRTRKMSRRNAEHDHIVPLSAKNSDKGNTFDNSQCLCRKCNGRKRSRRGAQMRLPFVGC
jgi:5-methylcytosine-specific restriction endonuclease McrA